jgi:putative oxidoreductase
MQKVKGIIAVVGRVMLCVVFLAAAMGHSVPTVRDVAQFIGAKGVIAANWAFVGGVVLLVVGSLAVAVGFKARFGASILLAFLLLATACSPGFTFWTMVNAAARQEALLHFITKVSLMGAMLFIIANGPGEMSLDGKH